MGTQTLLNYELRTEPFPLRASTTTGTPNGKLTIVASNPHPEQTVTIKKIVISIPLGSSGATLSIDPSPDPIPPVDWKCDTSEGQNVAVYTFKPNAGKGQVDGQGLAFIFNAIQVNSKPGTVDVTLVEEVRDDEAICNLKITKFPAGWGKGGVLGQPRDSFSRRFDLSQLAWTAERDLYDRLLHPAARHRHG